MAVKGEGRTAGLGCHVVFAFGGMLLFFLDDISTEGMLGNALAAVSGFTLAMFTIFMRMQKDGSPIESVILGNILTAVIGVPFLSTGYARREGMALAGGIGCRPAWVATYPVCEGDQACHGARSGADSDY
ncbi:MAG: hypothetical protein ACOX4M_05655 [Acetivibrionales bacterium]